LYSNLIKLKKIFIYRKLKRNFEIGIEKLQEKENWGIEFKNEK